LTAVGFAKFDNAGHFIVANENTYTAFYPFAGKRYIASVWIKNSAVTSNTQGIIKIGVNTSEQPLATSQSAGPVIDGWRRVEVQFSVPDNARVFTLTLDPSGGEAYFDDVRVHPYNSLLKSFVYNPSNFFLMAELDENNYATMYEYDDEGTLIRIKKETERGMMTVKENRSYNKK
jgi:alpha-amylase/alpha-mannosidase (GH57 family)